jgi:DNA-binding SARP family transcriptional activator
MNEQYIKKYEEKEKQYADIESKYTQYEDIIKELEAKNNQYEQTVTFLRNTIGSLQNNAKLYTNNDKLELEQKLEIVCKKLEQEEQNNIDMHTTNENIKQQLLIYMEKCKDIPYLQIK